MPLKNSRGQMAIFFVFIFQILFILFAMTLNVALVVHDKINMQNSLDLAAMYGAKKQAEVLNSIAHINYQMRQNYKLLAWRYRILGTLTQKGGGLQTESWCPQNQGQKPSLTCQIDSNNCAGGSIYPNNYCDKSFAVCINTPVWWKKAGGSDYCQTIGISVPRIPQLQVIAPHLPWNIQAAHQQSQLIADIADICKNQTEISWLMTQLFLSHFRLDQKDRKIMIQAIYNKTLKVGKDLDGNSIHDGAEKVFKKNLNFTNFKNYQSPTFFNSFKSLAFNQVFEPLNIFPVLNYTKLNRDCSGFILPHTRSPNTTAFANDPAFAAFISNHQTLFDYNKILSLATNNYIGTLTLGYTKKQTLTLYYGLRAELSYANLPQLFAPPFRNPPTLKGSSFAKPFGGRIGPTKYADPILKAQIDRASSTSGTRSISTANIQPNYSRYPGDQWGLIDRTLHENQTAFLKKTQMKILGNPSQPYHITYFSHLNILDRADPLAISNRIKPLEDFIRTMELMAVFPDVFDITYYSIFNNYMETYFPKICKLIGTNNSDCRPDQREAINFSASRTPGYIRGDFGYPNSQQYLLANLSETKIANSFVPFYFAKNKNPVNLTLFPNKIGPNYSNINIRYPHLVSDPAHFLTAWAPTTNPDRYNNYDFPSNIFTKCYSPTKASIPVPTGCEQGGRSGYSIKTISCNLVKTILQPQPSNIDEYCP